MVSKTLTEWDDSRLKVAFALGWIVDGTSAHSEGRRAKTNGIFRQPMAMFWYRRVAPLGKIVYAYKPINGQHPSLNGQPLMGGGHEERKMYL